MSYVPAPINRLDPQVIASISEEALGGRCLRTLTLGATGVITWVANLAVFVPFGIAAPFVVKEVFWGNGSGAGGNIDVGVYDTAGNRLFSLGSTAKGTASNIITSSGLTDYTLGPGDYYMAFATDNNTANNAHGWAPAANNIAAFGVGQMGTAFPLPNPATIVPITNAVLPYFGLNGYTVAV